MAEEFAGGVAAEVGVCVCVCVCVCVIRAVFAVVCLRGGRHDSLVANGSRARFRFLLV